MAEPNEEKKKGFKFADAPHLISIIFSLTALVISYLSWEESHRSRLINQSSNRAITYVIDLQMVPKSEQLKEGTTLIEPPTSESYIFSAEYKLVVKNIGRTPAKSVHCNYKLINKWEEGYEGGLHESERSIWEEILPGVQEEVIIPIKMELTSRDSITDNYLFGSLTYQDELTEEMFEYRWCYQLGNGTPEFPTKPCPKNFPESYDPEN